MTESSRQVPLVIAEAGVNHNGDLNRALALIDAAAEAGADVVKFQAYRTEELVSLGSVTAAYQKSETGVDSQTDLLKGLELQTSDFQQLAERCHARDVGFLATPFDATMTEDLVRLGMRYIKVASGELTNVPALRIFAGFGLPILLSTGMATLEEVGDSVVILRESGVKDITLLQCTSLYPAPVECANLRAMVVMGEIFGCPFGYSDHTAGDHTAIAATALGAQVIEKHLTLDRTLPGPDQKASFEPQEFTDLVFRIRDTAVALGDGVKRPDARELETAALVRRSWHAVRALQAGHMLSEEDVALKRPLGGLPPSYPPVGRRLRVAVSEDDPIAAETLEP